MSKEDKKFMKKYKWFFDNSEIFIGVIVFISLLGMKSKRNDVIKVDYLAKSQQLRICKRLWYTPFFYNWIIDCDRVLYTDDPVLNNRGINYIDV